MNKNLKMVIWLIVLILVVFVISKIFGEEKVVTAETISIGVLAPLTGPRADAGEFTKNALALAEEEIQNNQDLQYKLKFLHEDTKYEPPVAVTAFRKLLDFDKVQYVIGPYGSSEVLAVAPVAEQSKVVLVVTGAQSDEISQLGDYIFRIIHNSAQEAPIFAKFVAGKMKSDTLHFLAINTAITDPYLKSFTPSFEAEGKKIGVVEKFAQTATDFKTELIKIKSQNPTDIFLLASPKLAGLIIKQANELGIHAQFYNIGVEGPDLVGIAGPLAEGLLYPYSYDNHSSEPRIKDFYQKYMDRFGKEPDTIAANSYDAAFMLSHCLEENGNDVEKVKSCLYTIKDFNGASGIFSIDQNGDAIKNIFVKTVRDGTFVRYEE